MILTMILIILIISYRGDLFFLVPRKSTIYMCNILIYNALFSWQYTKCADGKFSFSSGLMLMWPVNDVFTADATAPPAATATISSAVASASSAIATASSAIATASSAIATASSAIATASSVIATTDPSPAVVDTIACDNDTAKLCNTAAASTSGTSGTSTVNGHDGDCSTVASTGLRLGHGADESPSARVDDNRIAVVRPRTGGVKAIEQIILTALNMFFEKLELAVYMSLYKLKVLYTTLISPVLHRFQPAVFIIRHLIRYNLYVFVVNKITDES